MEMRSPIDNLIIRIEKLMQAQNLKPDQHAFLTSIKHLINTYRTDPQAFSDLLLKIKDLENNVQNK
jgi:hypothetical protein